MAKLTKEDLVETIVKVADCSKKCATDCLNAILNDITKGLKAGKDVVLTGFGTFKVSKRKARSGRNPQTGATIKIPAKKVPKFKAGKALKDAVK
ncbi:HU family DNA-binding protein [bacterium]|nr:HU family DNA-binding protein [bacterium]